MLESSNNNRDVQNEAPRGKDTQIDNSQYQVGREDMQALQKLGGLGNDSVNNSLGKLELSGVTGRDGNFNPSTILKDGQQTGVSDSMKPYRVADASNKLPQSDSPLRANEMNEKLGIRDASGQIPKTAEYIKENIDRALTDPESSIKVQAAFSSAADSFRRENPNATAADFGNAMNNEFKNNRDVRTATPSVTADSDGNLQLSRYESPLSQRRGGGDKGVPVAEANIGDPTTGTQRADNLAQTFTPDHQGKLAADAVFATANEPKFGLQNNSLIDKITASNQPSAVFDTAVENLNKYSHGTAEPFFDAFNKRMGEVGGNFSASEVNRGVGTGGLRAEMREGQSVISGSYRDADPPLNRR